MKTIEIFKSLPEVKQDEIRLLHRAWECISEALSDTRDPGEIYRLKRLWKDNEYRLQVLWGFPEDPRFHRYWDLKGCTCPTMDNNERVGTNYTITNGDCPLHGTDQMGYEGILEGY